MSALLRAVRAAARRRADADTKYRAAITAAYPDHTLEEIGRAAGLTAQGVHYLLRPDPRKGKR